MIDEDRLEAVKKKCGFLQGVCLSSNGNSGGIGFWWRDIDVNVISYSSHHFEANIVNQSGEACWKALGVYGWPAASQKHLTWSLIKSVMRECLISAILFGDFKEILTQDRRRR